MNTTMKRDEAETVALRALGWILAEEGLRSAFLNASGVAPDDLRHRAGDPDFLLAVLDFLLSDDRHVVAFCTDAGLPMPAPMAARAALPGGAEYAWT